VTTFAAIDVGSNATRFATLKVSECGVPEPLQLQRFSIRLGADVFAQGSLGPAIRATLREAFVTMAAAMRERGVTRYRAVATSAMRDAKNSAEVVAELTAASGLNLEIISGLEESELARDALVRAMGSVPAGAVIADLGGGSLELDRPGSKRGRSLPLGTVRLLQRFPHLRQPAAAAALEAVRAELRQDLARGWPRAPKTPVAVGTGGNLELLAQLVGDTRATMPQIVLPRLPEFLHTVAAMPVEERIAQYKLRPDRADLIVPATLVILALHDWLGLKTLVVPKTGLRDALLYAMATAAADSTAVSAGRPDGEKAWQRRSRRAERWLHPLFEKLTPLHGLFPAALVPLRVAHAAWAWGCHESPAAPLAPAREALTGNAALSPSVRALAQEILVTLDGPAAPHPPSPAAKLAALVRIADCAAASTGLPKFTVDLLVHPATLTLPVTLAMPPPERTYLGQVFDRPLILSDR